MPTLQVKDEVYLLLHRAVQGIPFQDLRNYMSHPTSSESPDVQMHMQAYLDKVWPAGDKEPSALLVTMRHHADEADSRLHNQIPVKKLQKQAQLLGFKLVPA